MLAYVSKVWLNSSSWKNILAAWTQCLLSIQYEQKYSVWNYVLIQKNWINTFQKFGDI